MDAISTINATLVFGSTLAVLGILSSLAASRFGAPLLIVFLAVGMLAGEDGPGGFAFSDYALTYAVGSLAIAIILFDGGLRTRVAAVSPALSPALTLATLGVLVTAAITGVAAALFLKLETVEALLVGAVVASTDAAVVFFLLRTRGLRLRRRVGAVLELESGTNDPFAVLLTLVLVDIALGRTQAGWQTIAVDLVREATFGVFFGVVGGLAIVAALNRLTLPSGLHAVFVLTAALLLFSAAQALGGSGFLAVYLAGLLVGNRPVRAFASISAFTDTATWLCQIVMFIMLGLLVTPSRLVPFLLPAAGVAAVLMFVARPAAVALCLAPFRFSWRETAFVSWMGLRGGVSIFLAAIPTLAQLPRAELYFNVAFVVVLVSLLLQGWTVEVAARRFRVALPDPAPEVKRIEIDLPGQLEFELVGYPIFADSPALRSGVLPDWVKPVLVVRREHVEEPGQAGPLQVGDYGYFLVEPQRVKRLDRFFAIDGTRPELASLAEFPFDAALPLGTVADLYGIAVAPQERGHTVADVFSDRLDDTPQEGDRIDLGTATLIAHDVQDGVVRLAGLLLVDQPDEDPASSMLARAAKRFRLWLRRQDEG
jgi:cell volume regulation protein A